MAGRRRLGRGFVTRPVIFLTGDLDPPKTVTVELEDSFSFLDELITFDEFTRGPSDSLSFSDTLLTQDAIGRSLSDSFSFSEDLQRGEEFGRIHADVFSFSDSLSAAVSSEGTEVSASLEDELRIAFAPEDLTTEDEFRRGLSDSLSFSDTLSASTGQAGFWTDIPDTQQPWVRMEDYTLQDQTVRADRDFAPIVSSWGHWPVTSSASSLVQINSEESISGSVLVENLP